MKYVRYLVWHRDLPDVFASPSEHTAKLTAVREKLRLSNLSPNYVQNNVILLFDAMVRDGWNCTPIILDSETKD